MKNKKFSLYLALGIIIITVIIVIMSLNSTYTYINTKNKIIKNMKNNSEMTILSLNDNIKNMIESYSINEYYNLIQNEISRRDIFAIIIHDYNMGKIIGEESYISGKIKSNDSKIIDYDIKNKKQSLDLENCFYSSTYNITSPVGKKLGTISIYISSESMNKELNSIIISTIQNSIFISITLIFFLFITIRAFILKPISDIVETLKQRDQDGIPIKTIPNNPLIEMNILSTSINDMIGSIKESRNILKKEQYRLEYLLEASPIAIRIARNKGQDVIFANKSYSRLLQLDKDNTLHKNPKDYYSDKNVYDSIIQSLKKDQSIYNKLVELNIKDQKIWALASYMNIDFDGEKTMIGWFYDVTNEKNNENKLFEALELQTTIFDNAGYLIIRTDTKGIIQQINKETEKLLGYQANEIITKFTPLKFHLKNEVEQKRNELSENLNIIINSQLEVLTIKSKLNILNENEWTYVTKEGKHIPILSSVSALKNKDNEIYGYLNIVKDISHNKLIESQSKLASMGEMIGNISHQWRQPLSVISTISSGIKIKSEFNILKDGELIEDMDSITEQAQYLSKTIDDFRDFMNNNTIKEKVNISTLIEKAINISKSSMINNNIELIIDIKNDDLIDSFQNQLIQALINILNNAKDAIQEKIKESSEKYIFIKTYKKNDDLVLVIKDNAGGIRNDIIHKIFDPYFTTKHKSIGTGIGLSMAYQIVTKHHDANVQVSNETYTYDKKVYTGARFDITFLL